MAKVAGDQKLAPGLVIAAPFYELPRIKLCCERAGLEMRTMRIPLRKRKEGPLPTALRSVLIRESTAFWLSYLQPFGM